MMNDTRRETVMICHSLRYRAKHTILDTMKNALTIDLEEYFQVHALSDIVPVNSWDSFSCEAPDNTKKILDVLDESGVSATFFCLGWNAQRNPKLIESIHDRGHEVACHGHMHQLISTQDPKVFREDVSRAKKTLEDSTGEEVIGYRAPTYSITNKTLWAFDILEELGFRYDSSIFPIYHDNYGIPDAPRFPYRIPGRSLAEFPISTMKLGAFNFPVAGGGYFRLFPYLLTRSALKHLEKSGNPFIFYIHPWEVNSRTPRVEGISALSRFRTYVGLAAAYGKFCNLLKDFEFTTARDVLRELGFLDPEDLSTVRPGA